MIPKIVWNANDLDIGYPLDNAVAYPEPVDGSDLVVAPSGARDAWIPRTREILVGDVRWIPTTDTTDPVATGWDGATGWAAFLAYARKGNAFDFYPDRSSTTSISSYLLEPFRGEPPIESDGSRRLRLKIESVDGSAYTGY